MCLVSVAVDMDSDAGSYPCLHHSLNGYVFLCFSSLTCQRGNIIVNKVMGVSAPYLDKLVKHTESMWDWAVKLSDYTN